MDFWAAVGRPGVCSCADEFSHQGLRVLGPILRGKLPPFPEIRYVEECRSSHRPLCGYIVFGLIAVELRMEIGQNM